MVGFWSDFQVELVDQILKNLSQITADSIIFKKIRGSKMGWKPHFDDIFASACSYYNIMKLI